MALARRWRWTGLISSTFLCFLLPVTQLVARVPNAGIYDRYLLLPTLGLALAAALGLAWVHARGGGWRHASVGLGTGLLAMWMVLAGGYVPKLESDLASTAHGYASFPGWSRVAFDHASALVEEGEWTRAREIAETEPTFDHPTWVRDYFLGRIALGEGDIPGAIEHLGRASRLTHVGGYFPYADVPLADAYVLAGQPDRADALYEAVLRSPLSHPVWEYRAQEGLSRDGATSR